MPALYAGKRVGKPLLNGHTYNALFNGKLVWPIDRDTVVSIRITDDKGKPLPKSLAVNGTLKLGAKATYADSHVGDLLTTNDVTFASRDTSTATVSGNTLTWRHGGTILVTATVNGFTSAAVSISAAYAPESIQGPLALFGDSQHFAKTRQLGERTEKFDGRLDELCRDTIKNTIISLIYGDQSHDHSEAVRYELTKLEKLDAQCWIISAAEKYLEDRQ